MIILGVDDAGRGPVIGPMVLAGCVINKEDEKDFIEKGITDSKLVLPKKREILVEYIKKKSIAWSVQLINPSEIDTGMGIGLNLNETEALASAVVIKNLIETLKEKNQDYKELKIYLDCPSINTISWKQTLSDFLKKEKLSLNLFCEHKADLIHPVVSAASIIAKTTRDNEIKKLKKELGIDFGSGYPADPKTRAFLDKHVDGFKKQRIFRESWATWQKAHLKRKQRTLPDY